MRKNKLYITCNQCQSRIERCPSQIKKTNFCSRDCHYKFIRNKSNGRLLFKDQLTKEFLIQEYIKNRTSSTEIANIVNCTHRTVLLYLKRFNINTRSISESVKNIRFGKNNPNWKNGLNETLYAKEWDQILRNQIKERDNFTCQYCRITEKDHIKKFNRHLSVHHIDYNKQNCNKNNLITTCVSCNSIANGDRDYWYAYYKYIIENYIYNS